MKPSKDLDEQIDEIRQHCDSLGVPSLWYDKLIKLIEQREREARIAELNRIAVAVEDRRTADSFDGRVYVTKLSNIDDRIEALQKGKL